MIHHLLCSSLAIWFAVRFAIQNRFGSKISLFQIMQEQNNIYRCGFHYNSVQSNMIWQTYIKRSRDKISIKLGLVIEMIIALARLSYEVFIVSISETNNCVMMRLFCFWRPICREDMANHLASGIKHVLQNPTGRALWARGMRCWNLSPCLLINIINNNDDNNKLFCVV